MWLTAILSLNCLSDHILFKDFTPSSWKRKYLLKHLPFFPKKFGKAFWGK